MVAQDPQGLRDFVPNIEQGGARRLGWRCIKTPPEAFAAVPKQPMPGTVLPP
jgi:hypothetical protein